MYTTHDFINIKLASSTLIICNENKDAANSTSKKDKIYFVNVEYSEWIPAVYKCNRQKKIVNPHWYKHNKHALLALKSISILSIYLVLTKTTFRIKKSLIVNTIA